MAEAVPVKPAKKPAVDLHVLINNKPVTLKGKSDYLFVDIFDFYDFDLSKVNGSKLITKVNERSITDYLEGIDEGSVIELYWEK